MRGSLILGVVASYLAWAGFGWLFGWHWLVLIVVVCCCRKPLVVSVSSSGGGACVPALYFLLFVSALLALGLGGGYARTTSRNVGCAGNETMSRRCLFEEQPTDYAVIYVLHFIGLGWMAAMWIADGVQIPSWVAQASRGEPLRCLWSDRPLASATYPLVLLCAVALVTLTWTALYDWSTSDGLGTLLGIILGEIAAVLLVACAVLHWERLPLRGGLRGKSGSSSYVNAV